MPSVRRIRAGLLLTAALVAAASFLGAPAAHADAGPWWVTPVIHNVNGAGEQFEVATDCHVYHHWQSYPGGPWSPWQSLGGCTYYPFDVGMNADGRLEVFVIGTDYSVWHIWQIKPASGPWSSWKSLNGKLEGGSLHISSRLSGLSEIHVYALDRYGVRWVNHQTAPDCCWSGWNKG